MAIARQEIWVQSLHVHLDMPDSMRGVNQTQHSQLFTCLCQALKWNADSRHTHHGIKDSNLDFSAELLHLLNFCLECLHEPVILHWIGVLNFHRLCRRSLGDVLNGEIATLVDSGEVYNVIAFFERQVAQDCVDSGRGVGDEDNGLWWCIDDLCDSGTGCVEVGGIFPADEVVRASFC